MAGFHTNLTDGPERQRRRQPIVGKALRAVRSPQAVVAWASRAAIYSHSPVIFAFMRVSRSPHHARSLPQVIFAGHLWVWQRCSDSVRRPTISDMILVAFVGDDLTHVVYFLPLIFEELGKLAYAFVVCGDLSQ